MHELHELKERLMDTLIDYGKKEMTASNLEVIDKLTHTIKNLCKIMDDSEYSERYSRTRMSYADRRDAKGRYVSDDGMIRELREMAHDAPDSRTRMEIENLIRKMENK